MTNKQRLECIREMGAYTDRDAYVSDLALSSVWADDDDDAESPQERIDELSDLWDAWHCTVKDIAAAAGMSCRKLAERFGIPYRTMEGWSSGKRVPPDYILAMMREILCS